MVLPPSEVQGEELLRSVAHFQRQMLKKREEQGRLLPAGAGLEPKSAQDKGTGQCGPGASTRLPAGTRALRSGSVCAWRSGVGTEGPRRAP